MAAQRENMRMSWDLSVLKRTLPEIESAALMSGRMLEVTRSSRSTCS